MTLLHRGTSQPYRALITVGWISTWEHKIAHIQHFALSSDGAPWLWLGTG